MCQINKKIKAHYHTIIRGYLTYRLALSIFIWSIWSRPFFTLRQNQKKKCVFFWGNEKKKICFWNCLTLKTVTNDIGKDNFTIVFGCFQVRNPNQFYFTESCLPIAHEIFLPNFAALRKNPFSLEELTKVKIATSGVNLESLYLPIMIKDELKKYQELNKTFIGLTDWQYYLTHYGAPLWGIFKIAQLF